MDSFVEFLAYFTAIAILIFTLDDLFIDLMAAAFSIKPKKLSDNELVELRNLKEKKIAIMIANWKEDEVLKQMVTGNVGHISYHNYEFFLGVYPNDTATWNLAQELAKKYSHVHVIVNSQQGPTTKGQMLNEIFSQILRSEIELGMKYDLFMLHDSEDLIHPLSLKLINQAADTSDFVQIPVFSLPVAKSMLVAGTYVDEFSESHGKDLLVRSYMNAGVPSAGVGTAISRKLAFYIFAQQRELLNSNSLTEDYYLGISAHANGFTTSFVNAYRVLPSGKKDFIATREYFPQQVQASIRQKTRWTTGIGFQAFRDIGWTRSHLTNYFLWRDRRGFLNAILIVMSLALIGISLVNKGLQGTWPDFVHSGAFIALTSLNTFSMLLRIVQRIRFVSFFYDFKLALLVPVRWLVANYINTMASFKAAYTFTKSTITKTQPKWVKTDHILPVGFGVETEAKEINP